MTKIQEKSGLSNEDLRKVRSTRHGSAVDLQMTSDSETKRVKTEFVGMDGTNCLIFKFPDEEKWGALDNDLVKDKPVIARYILEDETGEIIAFKVNVLLVLNEPSHLVFTSFPTAIQSHDLRAESRAQTRIATNIVDAENDTSICDSVLMDISQNGCRMSIDKRAPGSRPKLKQEVHMYFSASKDKMTFLKGTIMNSKSDEVNIYYGVKFDAPEEVKQLLQSILLSTN